MPPTAETPVARYLEAQGRFQHLTADEISAIQSSVDALWAELMAKAHRAGSGEGGAGGVRRDSRT